MTNIALYGSHNATYVIEQDGQIVVVAELERLLNYKNSGLGQYKTPKVNDILFLSEYFPKYLMKKYGIMYFDNCYHANASVIMDEITYKLQECIPANNYIECRHHMSHAAGGFYQSPYAKALIFSFDGGGDDGKFNVYTCKRGESPVLINQVTNPTKNSPHIFYDLGFPYMLFAHYLRDIKQTDLSTGNLVYPGKLMGLASYGTVKHEWLPAFMDFFKNGPDGKDQAYEANIATLGEALSIPFSTQVRLDGQLAWDVAATAQRAFEDCFIEVAKPYMDQYPELPIVIVGGCALNIILNTRIKQEFKREVFVGPNPNDCGVALGMILNHTRPMEQVDVTYSGLELSDIDMLPDYIQNTAMNMTSHFVDRSIVDDLAAGKIIGVARGRSEHGPRALGNRSILCNPSLPNMKDILNFKVKNREWYRPFAPVVRLEDVSLYFEWEGESRWMSFCPTVREEYRKTLQSITHIDNTARVQTVTAEQNPWLYSLLTEFKAQTGIGVLLNTSFNVDGKPILSSVRDAFEIFKNTQLDGLIIEHYYFKKK